jgi:hypothetical protein
MLLPSACASPKSSDSQRLPGSHPKQALCPPDPARSSVASHSAVLTPGAPLLDAWGGTVGRLIACVATDGDVYLPAVALQIDGEFVDRRIAAPAYRCRSYAAALSSAVAAVEALLDGAARWGEGEALEAASALEAELDGAPGDEPELEPELERLRRQLGSVPRSLLESARVHSSGEER